MADENVLGLFGNKFYSMTPKEIVAELDKYIIGQDGAKRSVAVALRNRYRRGLVEEKMREEITPKNILMMGPTGVGKTEIARRLAKLMDAPFVKVEATKFTEVGYVGRDVDSMVRDLVEASIRITKQKRLDEKYSVAEDMAEEKILDAIAPGRKKQGVGGSGGGGAGGQALRGPFDFIMGGAGGVSAAGSVGGTGSGATQANGAEQPDEPDTRTDSEVELTREQVRQQLRDGFLDEQYIEIEVSDAPKQNQLDVGEGGMGIAIGNIFDAINPGGRKKKKKLKVKDARRILREEEAANLIDMDQVTSDALENAEQNGIIFIDEIDKIASGGGFRSGADVSREGVQRDILPIVEGSVVNTKHGPVKTDHILFIGAGAFHTAKPTDLIPELQGRFPIRVELETLTEEAFVSILTEPENALIKQHKALLETEGVELTFTDEAIKEIAHISFLANEQTENIGARRLHTVMEKLLEDQAYSIPDSGEKEIMVDRDFVVDKFLDVIKADDVDRYIL
ncbi:MAG: ATP-dependent protease ATPase subunit HslU [Clostridiales bacterium]|nr:ATP-dependent protease ATPase subunit HslU [Clostridiales bacterium]